MVSAAPRSREVAARAACPCDSGLPYGRCCKLKNFKWMKDEQGDFAQVVPISPQMGRVLESSKTRFKRIFGREPHDTDPIFLEKYLLSIRDVQREMMDAMLQTGMRPEIMYAYRKTGRLLTRKNESLLPEKDIEEWDAAIEEY